jgi:hypothetical protein
VYHSALRVSAGQVILTALLALCLFVPPSHAQISAGGTPPSFPGGAAAFAAPTVTLSALDRRTLIDQAEAEEAQARTAGVSIPYYVADVREVNLNLNNSGQWQTLPDGTRIWKLRLVSPGAAATHLIYSRWWFPKGAELYLYNDDHSEVMGAFTNNNNFPLDSTNVTGVIGGEAVTLEYVVHPEAASIGELSVGKVLHHFRGWRAASSPLDSFNESSPCEMNINCPAGAGWQTEKRSVALYFTPDGGQCSGAMINDTRLDGRPYFLSAYHCYPTNSGSNFLFVFNYESPNCSNIDGPHDQTVGNAYVWSRWQNSDFLLLLLSTPPPISYNPYYAGWDWTGNTPGGATEIAHPRGDIKKISARNSALYSTDWNGNWPNSHWGLNWDVGTSETGSSGSPWFDPNHRIVAQLHGGFSDCTGAQEAGGKFSASWFGGGDSGSRLSDYLDPGVGNPGYLNGYQPVAPPNDLCANATLINTIPYNTNGNTRFATNDFANCTGHVSPDVWWRINLPCSTLVTVNTCGSYFDTELYVYRGTCAGYYQEVACNDDGGTCQLPNSPGWSQVQFWTIPNQDYYMVLSGYGGQSGIYYLSVTGVSTVSNDACPGTVVSYIPYTDTGNTSCATGSGTGTTCGAGGNPSDVWYRVQPQCDGWVDVSLCGSSYDTVLEIWYQYYPPNCGGAMNLLDCNDDYCGLQSFIHTYFYHSNYYYVRVTGYNVAAGPYTLNITPSVAGDNCSNAISIASLPFSATGNTDCVSPDFSGCYDFGAPDMIYSYTPASCHVCRASLCGSGYDTQIFVRSGGACPGDWIIACNDDYCGLQSQVDFNATAGVTYYIIVSAYFNLSGPYVLNVSNVGGFTPATDVCSTAPTITSLPYTDYGNTACMYFNYPHCGGTAAPDAVYGLYLPQCDSVTATLCGSSYDTRLDVYTAGSCPGTTLVTCNDDSYCGNTYTLQSTVSFRAQANTSYWFIVSGYGTYSGLYALNVTGTPCAVAPPPVSNQVVEVNHATGDITLNWTAVSGATIYHVYRGPDSQTLFQPGNIIANIPGTTYTCAGCAADANLISFFGVIAENSQGPALDATGDISTLTKADAVQGPVTVAFDKLYPVDNEEHAVPGKALSVKQPIASPPTSIKQ